MKQLPSIRRARGAAAIEFALVFLVAWILVQLCWVVGNFVLQRSIIKEATREGAMMVASATPAELASGNAEELEERAAAMIEYAATSGGNEVLPPEIIRRVSGAYAPSLQTVEVTVDVTIIDPIFPEFLPGIPVKIVVEVPHGSRLAGP